MDTEEANKCECHKQGTSVSQTLSEFDFDRGIWNAAIYNEPERVRHFISRGRSMDRDNFDYTALHYAARNGNRDICFLLIQEGNVDVNAVTKGGVASIHRAAMMGHIDIVDLLVNANAKIDLQDMDGKTALHRAASQGHYNVCKYLVEKKPELKKITDKSNKIPLEYIPNKVNEELKNILSP